MLASLFFNFFRNAAVASYGAGKGYIAISDDARVSARREEPRTDPLGVPMEDENSNGRLKNEERAVGNRIDEWLVIQPENIERYPIT